MIPAELKAPEKQARKDIAFTASLLQWSIQDGTTTPEEAADYWTAYLAALAPSDSPMYHPHTTDEASPAQD